MDDDNIRRSSLFSSTSVQGASYGTQLLTVNAAPTHHRRSTTFDDYHRDLSDGGFRGAIFGFSDGLATNLCLVVGVQIALDIDHPHQIVLTGIAGLLAGAFSMGCGEYISMMAQREAMLNEINRESDHLTHHWDAEMSALEDTLKKNKALQERTISNIIDDLSKCHHDAVVAFHARMELGIDPDDQGSPWKAAIYSFICFCGGAFIPLIPYLVLEDNHVSCKLSIGVCTVVSVMLGFGLGILNGVYPLRCIMRQTFAICFSVACSVGINYGFGHFEFL